MINSAITDFLNNQDSDINIQECFDEMFSGISNPVMSGIFLSLLKLEKENADNLLAGINSARNAIKKFNLEFENDFLIENICIDETDNYLDISFAMDIICACAEIGSVKCILKDFVCNNKSYKTANILGINTSDFDTAEFEKNKFLYGYLSSDSPYVKYTQELSRAIPYGTILDKINLFLNPYNVKNCSIGVLGRENAEEYAKLSLELGYKNSIIFSGGDFPYVSIEGETSVCEAWKNKIFSYSVTPDLLGIKPNSLENIKIENSLHGAQVIKDVFNNKLKDSFYDVIVINSGLALYITKKTKSLMEGIELAKSIIDKGEAREKLISLQSKAS